MRLALAALCLCAGLAARAQPAGFFRYAGDSLVLDNGVVRRVVQLRGDSASTTSLTLAGSDTAFVRASEEFAFLLDGERVDGHGGWTHEAPAAHRDDHGGRGATVVLRHVAAPLEVRLDYLLYPGLPVVRKRLTLRHTGTAGDRDLRIEALDVEALQTTTERVNSIVHHQYARMQHIGRFVGDWHDPVVVVHDRRQRFGIALGNEAVGVVKRTAYNTEGRHGDATIGMTHPGQDFPWRRWLRPGETYASYQAFVAPYVDTDDAFAVVDGPVNRFATKHMGLRFPGLAEKPTFVYNTWNPFRTFLDDTLVAEVAAAAAACGVKEFVIDDGWQVNDGGTSSEEWWGGNYGDWVVDTAKFPGGLRPSFREIERLGMKPGLWISVAGANADATVFREHPEWFVVAADGTPGNLHYTRGPGDQFYTASMGTDWYGYIRDKILGLVKDYGLAYAKLDFAVVTSAYVNDDANAGSYATDHPRYRDREESFGVLYRRLLDLFDELHAEAPELFLDCTFETAGKTHLMDYALARHAEGNWLSNIEEASPTGPLRVRQLAWWRSPALPAGSLVIGNLPMDDSGFLFGLKSLIGTLPVVLGDPRALAPARRAEIRAWAEWMDLVQARHDYMTYRRDLPGFGEPREGHWDGWQRVNFDTHSGGVVGVFRHGARERSRTVTVLDLDPAAEYAVREAPDGREVHRATGEALAVEGFDVAIEREYDGRVFEVARLR